MARALQGMVGNPTDRKDQDTVSKKLLPNCPITTHEITNANSMFGTNLAGVWGKTGRKTQVG